MTKPGPKQLPRTERFWSRVDSTDTDGCWQWTQAVNKRRGGYGYFYDDDRRNRRAHRVAWELATDTLLSEEQHVLHACDNPICCRPDHLFLGNQDDNMKDMYTKRRAPLGEQRPSARLTDEGVRWARTSISQGMTKRRVAITLGVHEATIGSMMSGKTWRHVL